MPATHSLAAAPTLCPLPPLQDSCSRLLLGCTEQCAPPVCTEYLRREKNHGGSQRGVNLCHPSSNHGWWSGAQEVYAFQGAARETMAHAFLISKGKWQKIRGNPHWGIIRDGHKIRSKVLTMPSTPSSVTYVLPYSPLTHCISLYPTRTLEISNFKFEEVWSTIQQQKTVSGLEGKFCTPFHSVNKHRVPALCRTA